MNRMDYHPASLLLLPICTTIHSIAFFSQHSTMASWSGDEHGFEPELWHQQSENFEVSFPLKGKSDFRSIHDVRSYALKQTVLWPRCSHGEFCVMQVYHGWNNSGHCFWHYPHAWVSNVHKFVHHVSLVCYHFLAFCGTPPNQRIAVSHNKWIHQLLISINSTSTTSRMSSSTT
jgi:hypothetical protein